jgi:thiol-disulfide isomerase/thioredoxin
MAEVSGSLSKPLRALLDAEGRHNLAHPALPWSATEMVDDLDFLMNRDVPASALPTVKPLSLPAASKQLVGSPTALAGLHKQAGELLGGLPALTHRIAELHGHPIVVNIWASSCGPCRTEFPLLSAASVRYGHQVAFLGVDVDDNAKNARAFLGTHPVSYPSYTGSSDELGSLTNGNFTPTTVYISPDGKIRQRHIGQYDTLPALENDIEHYALGVHG